MCSTCDPHTHGSPPLQKVCNVQFHVSYTILQNLHFHWSTVGLHATLNEWAANGSCGLGVII
jgi:hypothetical protein